MGGYDSTTGAWDKVAHLRCRSLSEFDHLTWLIKAEFS